MEGLWKLKKINTEVEVENKNFMPNRPLTLKSWFQ